MWERIIVSAAATSAGPGAWDFPDSRRWRALLRPRTGALRLVPAAPAREMFRLTGRTPAATLNTYLLLLSTDPRVSLEPAPESEALSLGASVNDLGPEIERRPCASTLPDRAAKRILRT